MPLVIDLCCGVGGWTNGFLAEGWEAAGIDIRKQPQYKGFFIECDLLEVTVRELAKADFIVCSTPCEQFSVHCMKHFHPNPSHPHLGITLFNHARTICEQSGKPYIMENVRCAERFVGKAVNHCGPFYFWGNAVPAIFPPEFYGVTKGTLWGLPRKERKLHDPRYGTGRDARRDELTAQYATIPIAVARYVARCNK